ncbi:MAG: tRNA 2-thiocytidine biosynthesis protein TtcA [Solobacterium sp.]|nr:tRNA 2-thiocytidine biosynthesis protein TtcA [Solobacterium sp.]
MARQFSRTEEIERSINRKYRRTLWAPFVKAVHEYELIQPGDRIAVCISGGKDSMCMAKLFQQYRRLNDIPFETEFLVLDPGYNEANRERIVRNLEILGIQARILPARIFDYVDHQEGNPCYLCARMRRGYLYSYAREAGCTKIALGHHFNDVIETTVMAMFYSSKLETMVPKLKSTNFEGMELIRPMYMIHEEDIVSWAAYNDLQFLRCACRMTEKSETGELDSKRKEIKELLKELKKKNPEIEHNIFRALHAVQIETFPGYKAEGRLHSFLEKYDQ